MLSFSKAIQRQTADRPDSKPAMAPYFVDIDPETGGDHYPAVLIGKETGDFLFRGGPSPTRTRWRPSLRTAR
jgi:hypothetical protein